MSILIFLINILGIGGLGIGDWGLGPIPNPQSPIPNPQSPIPILYYLNLKYIIQKFINNEIDKHINILYYYFFLKLQIFDFNLIYI